MTSLVGKKFIIRENMREKYRKEFWYYEELLALSEPEVIFSLEENEYGWKHAYRASGVGSTPLPQRAMLTSETLGYYFQEVPEGLSEYLFKSFRVVNHETIHGFTVDSVIYISGFSDGALIYPLEYEYSDSDGNPQKGHTSPEFLDVCCVPVQPWGEGSSEEPSKSVHGLLESYIFNRSPITGEELASHLIKHGDITAEGFAKIKPELFTKEYKVADFHQWILEVPYGRNTDSVVALYKAEPFKVYFHKRHELSEGEYSYETNVHYKVESGESFNVCIKKELLDKFCYEVTK